MRKAVGALVLAAALWGGGAQGGAGFVLQDFEAPQGEGWERVAEAAVGQGAGATDRVATTWGGLSLFLDGVPEEADGLAFWVRTADGRTAALTFAFYEREGGQAVEAFGERFWATPTWQRYTFPLAGLDRVWAKAGNKEFERGKVGTLQFQRLIHEGGLGSARLVFDQIEFVQGCARPSVERLGGPPALVVDAGKTAFRYPRFWRAVSVGDTVEQNPYLEGPEGEAMRVLGRDRPFDFVRLAWHVNPRPSGWIKFRYGAPFYSEDAAGRPVYRFEAQDALVERLRGLGLRPMMLLHGLPAELASEPADAAYGACITPPKDYGQWRRLVKTFVQHYVDKYGAEEVAGWSWEIWNEPDLWWQTWKRAGKDAGLEELLRLFDHAAAAIREVLPGAKIGGPAVAGYPRGYPAQWLRHAVSGTNTATGATGSPLGFLSYHNYEGVFGQMVKLYEAAGLVAKHAPGRGIEIHVTEYGNAIWGPARAGRSQASALCHAVDAYLHAARQDGARVDGLYWFGVLRSFSGECDAFFAPPDPKRRYQITTLFLHVKDTLLAKPVYNAYRALKGLGPAWLEVSGASFGERVRALASASEEGRRVSVLVYHHDVHDPTTAGPAETVGLAVRNLPFDGPMRVRRYRIDSGHGDVYAAWEPLGSPSHGSITSEQVARIKARDAWEPVEAEQRLAVEKGGTWATTVRLEPHAVALFVLERDG